MEKTIVLLRAVNVGGRKLLMAELRDACRAAGIDDIQTYIQSGNLIFAAPSADDAETQIECLIADRFGMTVEAIGRSAREWAVYAAGSPFVDADGRGNMIMLCLARKRTLAADTAARLSERALHGETIVVKDDAIWIDFSQGVGSSKLSPTWINRCAGSPVTMRNWRTVLKIAEMTRG
ncbi:MAG: DUF1697 domain-containing protein [Pseudomonadota bacterium]